MNPFRPLRTFFRRLFCLHDWRVTCYFSGDYTVWRYRCPKCGKVKEEWEEGINP